MVAVIDGADLHSNNINNSINNNDNNITNHNNNNNNNNNNIHFSLVNNGRTTTERSALYVRIYRVVLIRAMILTGAGFSQNLIEWT